MCERFLRHSRFFRRIREGGAGGERLKYEKEEKTKIRKEEAFTQGLHGAFHSSSHRLKS